jgi:putative ABC transport system permease protein
MNRLVVSNLLHRPIRSLISVVAIALEVTLILVIVGLSLGMLNDSKQRTRGIGADVMVQPPNSTIFGAMTGAPVSIKVAEKIRTVHHVVAVTPVVTQLSTAGAVEVIYGVDLASFERVGGPLHYQRGGPYRGPNDIIVDDFVAGQKNLHVGSVIDVLNHPFRISGIVEHGRGARKYLPITTLQDLIGAQGKASIFYVKVDDPARADAVAAGIKAIPGMEQYSIRTLQQWLSLMTPENLPGFSTFISVVIAVAVIIGFIVIFQAMYTAVMERTREIGILKSMGASKYYIINVVLRETLLLAVVGILFGFIISAVARTGLVHRFPTIRIELSRQWLLRAAFIALVGAMLGAVYPAFKAARKDPIDALAYE